MQQTPLYRDLLLRRQTVCCTNISTRDKGPHARYRMASEEPAGGETGRKARRKPWISRRSCRRRRRFVFSRLTSIRLTSTTSSTAIRLRPDDSLRPVMPVRYTGRRMQEGMDCWYIIYCFPPLIYNTLRHVVINYCDQMTMRVLNRRDRRYAPRYLTVRFGPLSWANEYNL